MKYIVTFLLIFFSYSCTANNKGQPNIIRVNKSDFRLKSLLLTKIFEYETSGASLFSPFSAYSDDGFLFVFDNASGTIYKFNNDGTFSAKTGREGRGPGEFLTDTVVELFICNKKLFAFDWSQPRIQVFNKDLDHLNIIQLEGVPYEATCLKDESFIVLYSTNNRLNVISTEGEIKNRVNINGKGEEGKYKFKLIESLSSGIYAYYFKDIKLVKYNDDFVPTDSIYFSKYLENSLSSISKNSFVINNEAHFFTIENTIVDEEKIKYSHVINPEHEYSYTYLIPDSFHNYQLLTGEHLLAFEDSSNTLALYKYQFDE